MTPTSFVLLTFPAGTTILERMTGKVLFSSFLLVALAACSALAGSPNPASPTNVPSASPTTRFVQPTSIPITIPTACDSSARAGDWPEQADSNDWSAKVAVACLASPSEEEIVRVLFTVWLAHFQGANIPEEYRLEKFAILSMEDLEVSAYDQDKTPAGFTAVVTYSVEPVIPPSTNPASWWVAGDGFVDQDGWIRGKKDAVRVIKNGEDYEISVAPYGTA